MSHLDYNNAVLYGCQKRCIQLMQRVQNIAAKVILKKSKYHSNTDLFKKLHWLPISSRIEFRILCHVWKCLNNQAPKYLIFMLKVKSSEHRSLRSAQKHLLLEIPWVKRETFAWRSFSVAGPRLWNNLPNHLRLCTTLSDFKTKLKTYIFSNLYCQDNEFVFY